MPNSKAMGEHYVHGSPLETIKVMEFFAREWTKNRLSPEMICNLLQAAKYLSPRLGRKEAECKGTLEDDLLKIENYVHRARTGEWIKLEEEK